MKTLKRSWLLFGLGLGLAGAACIATINALADAPPVLSITSLGSNLFNIVITNGVSTTNYTLYWTPVLNDQNYSWQVCATNTTGETNFTMDVGTSPSGFFRVLLGNDADGDGIPDWQDAAPNDPAIGILSVTIDAPVDGAVLQ